MRRWSVCGGGQCAEVVGVRRWSVVVGGQYIVAMPTRQRRWSVCGGGQYIVASSAAVVVNI